MSEKVTYEDEQQRIILRDAVALALQWHRDHKKFSLSASDDEPLTIEEVLETAKKIRAFLSAKEEE